MSKKPRLLDGCSKAGGAGRGYQMAGFYVVGVDIEPQPHSAADEFIQADILEYLEAHGHEYDFIHVSPPCEKFTSMMDIRVDSEQRRDNHVDLITPCREILQRLGKPYVIENVVRARPLMRNPLLLCGSMFDLRVIRHRLFESSMPLVAPSPCYCTEKGSVQDGYYVPVYGNGGAMMRDDGKGRRLGSRKVEDWRTAMGIDWMTKEEIRKAIPPAYTAWIGAQLLQPLQMALL